MHSSRSADVIAVLAGTATEAEVALKHGVSEAEVREWRRMMADGLTLQPRRRRTARWVIFAAVVAALLGSTLAVGQSTCTQTLPAPLTTFCPNSPALASQANANFQQLVNWSRQKLGTEGDANINNTGGIYFGNTTRQMVNLWGTQYGMGIQNGTEYFRSGDAYAWYRGGSHSNNQFDPGGGVLAMRLDSLSNLSVAGSVNAASLASGGDINATGTVAAGGSVSASGNVTAGGQLQGGSLRQRGCFWAENNQGNTADNQMHTVLCSAGYYMVGWRCYATDKLDGQCAAFCCLP